MVNNQSGTQIKRFEASVHSLKSVFQISSMGVDENNKQRWIVDVACPADNKVCDKEIDKKERYGKLALQVKDQ